MEGGVIESALAQLRAGLDVLLGAELSALSSVDVMDVVEEVEVVRRRFEPLDQRLLAEMVTRGIAGEYARTSPADLLVERLRVRPAEANTRLARAAQLGPRFELTGAPLPPLLPEISAAVAAGEISGSHADVIGKAVRDIPDALEAEFAGLVEHALVEQARHIHPGQVARAAVALLNRLDPDGQAPTEEEQQRRRGFGLRPRADGSSDVYGRFTPELTRTLLAVFDALSAPCPAEDGTADPRNADQRRHDALLDLGQRVMRAELPSTNGVPVTMLVTMRLSDFTTGTGTATTAHGDVVAVGEILEQAADAQVVPVVLSDTGGILSYGQRRRLASCDQRLALAARDRGCSFPGCTRPPAWCQAHHVIAYTDGGPTDLTNLTLVCGYHHRNFEALGWSCHISNGVPEWTPPAWLDPDRQPRRNTAHHYDIDFDTG